MVRELSLHSAYKGRTSTFARRPRRESSSRQLSETSAARRARAAAPSMRFCRSSEGAMDSAIRRGSAADAAEEATLAFYLRQDLSSARFALCFDFSEAEKWEGCHGARSGGVKSLSGYDKSLSRIARQAPRSRDLEIAESTRHTSVSSRDRHVTIQT